MHGLNLQAFRAAPLTREPFPYLVLPGFVKPAACTAVNADYPRIDDPGSFPVEGLTYGPAFASLIQTLTGPEVRAAFEEKFGLDLKGRPTMLTVRGRCGTRDGHIHTDAVSKIITVLIYLNPAWQGSGGCLRLLRSPTDIEDVLVEVPPLDGTLVAFRRSDNSYHGHKPFVGPRRVIQLNWVVSKGTERYEHFRHRASAWFKRLVGWLRRPAA
jgi:SM-20-related protein